uniref:Ribosomal protein L10 n=1 Tax=Anthoceros agrestis TaxID=41834 RepID=A0A6B9PJP7_9EMBR|nr:ribosomal protein L10 [Anthoceros agrestis]QHD46964.1 ribosomal protein L10 [Anthoceros agrestis]QKD76655.1 ribosomal protein L10 [Anthoceros agrestis]
MQVRKIFLKKKAQEIDKQSPYILLFHCSGLISEQWRQFKNLLCAIHGKTLFQPSRNRELPHENKQNGFLAEHASKAGPTCFLYLTRKTPDDTWSQWPPAASYNQNLVLLYGKFGSTLLNHMDIDEAADLEITSVFQEFFWILFYSSYELCLCFNQPTNKVINQQT